MPKDEDIEAICLGQGWAACATSALLVRLFTVGGVQKEIFCLPGPVVSMAGHGEQLMIIYHRGISPFCPFYVLSSCFHSLSVTGFRCCICVVIRSILLFPLVLMMVILSQPVSLQHLTVKHMFYIGMPRLTCGEQENFITVAQID